VTVIVAPKVEYEMTFFSLTERKKKCVARIEILAMSAGCTVYQAQTYGEFVARALDGTLYVWPGEYTHPSILQLIQTTAADFGLEDLLDKVPV
jgi:hypothetical protein